MLPSLEEIKKQIEQAVAAARLEIMANEMVPAQAGLICNREGGLDVAKFLRDDPGCKFDYASNVTGVDWPETVLKEKVKVKKVVEGVEKEVEETVEKKRPGFLEAVYHLYSMSLKHGPLVIRLRTGNRTDDARLPSLTPV